MKKISEWGIEKLAHQVVFPRLNIFDYVIKDDYKSKIISLVKNGIGGFCVFGGNIEENIKVTSELQLYAEIPLLFAGDFENGLPMRLSEGTEFPHSMALGNAKSTEITKTTAKLIALEAKAIGVNWNLAPVADINSNPNNPVINIRSFGDNPKVVTAHTMSYINGCQSEQILACAKHFPGHGNTEVNSHLSLPILKISKEDFYKNELLPFMAAIAVDVQSIMVGHLVAPSLDDSGLPASLSKKIIQDLLINELKFKGLVVTDALEMKAIRDNYTSNEIAQYAIEAGVDVLLMPQDDEEFIQAIINLSKTNQNIRNNLINSTQKIIEKKRWAGLTTQNLKVELSQNLFVEHPYKALKFAYAAMKIIDPEKIIPINNFNHISVFALMNRNEDFDNATRFMKMFSDALEMDCDFAYLNDQIQPENLEEFKAEIIDSELVIFAIFLKNYTEAQSIKLPPAFSYIIDELSEGKKSIAILFGSPYYESELKTNSKILTYSDSYSSLASVIVKLSNRNLDWMSNE
jgi:beta-glucosidase-like glycosyl hydrolase